MKKALDYAKYFIKNGFDAIKCIPNTKDGNMKINKLCVFANMINIAEYNTPLFDDKILAFENGCVIENIRFAYRNHYYRLLAQCRNYDRLQQYGARNNKKQLDLLQVFSVL